MRCSTRGSENTAMQSLRRHSAGRRLWRVQRTLRAVPLAGADHIGAVLEPCKTSSSWPILLPMPAAARPRRSRLSRCCQAHRRAVRHRTRSRRFSRPFSQALKTQIEMPASTFPPPKAEYDGSVLVSVGISPGQRILEMAGDSSRGKFCTKRKSY